ncbi:uncharacterized protein BO95DRAFT_243406 [Aspergillus brunneoviolaceus CBS 621.78]|uniref:Uncharacterized protein n=1 Tax=Aspergillus brunneoviolaceus CBS 621.78 TaxID=1450534 RepID=A0ACD1FYT5_9EURO|nr:hypothetical protein BO95DRAFT_243406 [Aspergillus brunneoviolaceus CBS 621.78]RAH42144.1 hypothetical protein BO95DRAFT_243406 [Aspergillus brunneoviolaceus CBS 621.78]
MLAPKPPVDLEGHCSVIYDNTLYAYSANGFVSIPLELNATWTNLTMGEPVSDAACVTGGIDGDEDQHALYVVGGSGSQSNLSGLQRYSFQDKNWTAIPQENLANRTRHQAVYLSNSSSILVYGGHTSDQSVASSDTFAAYTTSPYVLDAFSASNASPAYHPVLLRWSDSEAVLVGGTTTPKGVHLFNPTRGWFDSNITLADSLSSDVQAALFEGTNGTKVLEAFDMSVSPNTVSSVELVKPGGTPANPATALTTNSSSSSQKREDSSSDYPTYSSKLASSTTRQNYSLAQGEDGLVVISSGSGTSSLAIFNQTANSWVNTTHLFYGNESEQQILGSLTHTTSTTASTSSSSASSSASTSSSAAAVGGSSSSDIGTIVGATLGAIVGVGVILILILLWIKRKKQSIKLAQGGDKDRLSFQDRGVEPLAQSAYPMAKSPAPLAAASVDSLAIFSGSMGDEKTPRSAGARPPYAQNTSPLKPSPLVTVQSPDASPSTYSPSAYSSAALDKELSVKELHPGGNPGDRLTNEGWSRYFQDNSATDLAGMQPQTLQPPAPGLRSNRTDSSSTAWPIKLTPLNFGFLDEPKPLGGQVISGSPTTEHASSIISSEGRQMIIPESQSARISTASSIGDDLENDPHWQTRSWMGRPPSSTYSRSYYNPSTRAPSMAPSMAMPSDGDSRLDPSSAYNHRGSSILIPDSLEPMPEHEEPGHSGSGQKANVNSDMSWLNLHGDK